MTVRDLSGLGKESEWLENGGGGGGVEWREIDSYCQRFKRDLWSKLLENM